jgi:hypothetical protein
VAFSALKDGDNPQVTSFPVPPGLDPNPEILIDLAMTEKPGEAVYDESRNGHSLILKGDKIPVDGPSVKRPEWKQENGRGYLHFAGQEAAQLEFKTVLQLLDHPPELTLAIREKFGVPHENYKPIFPLRQFTYEWWMRPEKPPVAFSRMSIFDSRWNPLCMLNPSTIKPEGCELSYQGDIFCGEKIRLKTNVSYGQWLHVAITHGEGKVILYVNGQKTAETDYDPKGNGFWVNRPQFHFGLFLAGEPGKNGFYGDLGPFRLYAKALTAETVAERHRSGWPSKKP